MSEIKPPQLKQNSGPLLNFVQDLYLLKDNFIKKKAFESLSLGIINIPASRQSYDCHAEKFGLTGFHYH